MRSEFRKGDLIVRIGEVDTKMVRIVFDSSYYLVGFKNGRPANVCGVTKEQAHREFVKVGRRDPKEIGGFREE